MARAASEDAERLRLIEYQPLQRFGLQTLQVNLGYLCNQRCLHCHVNAGPHRTELMDWETAELVLEVLRDMNVRQLDLTGGAPELNPLFRRLVRRARALGVEVIDRCNLTVLSEPGQEGLAAFLADQRVHVIASMPCYLEDNVDRQRGSGVYRASLTGIRRLNALGYGQPGSGLGLDLVYNPQGPQLPPPQAELERDYKNCFENELGGLRFNRLLTLANMPIGRFGAILNAQGELNQYLELLRASHRDENTERVMCRDTVSVDYQGYLYDCDFNQMLQMPMSLKASAVTEKSSPPHLRDLASMQLTGAPIRVAAHCFGCSAGQGSSCTGALSG